MHITEAKLKELYCLMQPSERINVHLVSGTIALLKVERTRQLIAATGKRAKQTLAQTELGQKNVTIRAVTQWHHQLALKLSQMSMQSSSKSAVAATGEAFQWQ